MKKKSTQKAQLVEGPVIWTLVKMTGPMLVAVLSFVIFNLVDTFFVGQLGTVQLAAVSFTFPVVLLLTSLSQGLSVGASAVISRVIGEGDTWQVKRLTTDSLILGFIIVGFFSTVGYLTIDPVYRLLGASDEVLPYIREYAEIWYLAVVFLVVPMIGNSGIQATGDTRTPAMIILFAVFVNIVLDPLLIFGIGPFPEWGIRGAALATAISRALTMIMGLYVLHFRLNMLTFEVPTPKELFDSWKKILYIGIPAAGTQMLIPISTAIITGMVAAYGTTAIAAYGVASKIETFGLAILLALSASLTPFVGQNWGAGHMDRVKIAVRASQFFAVTWGILLSLGLLLSGRQISTIFSDNPEVINALYVYLIIVPVSYAAAGMLQVVNSSLNAINKPLHSTLLSSLRLVVLYVPLAIIGSMLFDLEGIFMGAALANFGAGIVAFFVLRRVLNDPASEHVAPVAVSPAVGD